MYDSGNSMFKKIINSLIDQPFIGSLFIVDLVLVLFLQNTHILFSVAMIGSLVAVSMYVGQKLALFKL